MELNINIEEFQGPFQLLFELIEKEQVDIYNIPIHKITTDFIEAMETRELPAEQIADFILFASILLEIKSRLLLPDASLEPISLEDEDDPRHKLLLRLLEYKRIREVDLFLSRREQRYLYHVFNDDPAICLPVFETEELSMDSNLLTAAFKRFLEKLERFQGQDQPFFQGLKREHFSVSLYQQKILKELLKHEALSFEDLFRIEAPRGEWIATFLALLKLQQEQQIVLKQNETFAPLYIHKRTP